MKDKLKKILNRIKKYFTLILVTGTIYLLLEIFMRWAKGDMIGYVVGHHIQSRLSLTGWTSFWMIPIGGMCGFFAGLLNEFSWKWLKKIRSIGRANIAVLFTLGLELAAGILLNRVWGLGIWDYSNDFLNVLGQICFMNGVYFLLTMPFAFWLDDTLRFLIYDEGESVNIFTYYKNFVLLK